MANNIEYQLRLKDLFSKTMQGAKSQVAGLDGKMSALKNSLGGLKGAIAGAFAVGGVISFGRSVFQALDNSQKFHASIKTMLHGNENAAKALEEQLIQLAKTTPFELTEVQDATKQLVAYGFKAGDVVDVMKRLGDVSSGIGAPLGDVAYLYGTLKTSGRVILTDLNQFAGRGIPIWETLSKNMGKTTKQVRELVGAGKIGFKDVENAFKSMTNEGGQFFNLMNEQSKTVGGRLSNLSDAWTQLQVKIGESQTGMIATTLNWGQSIVDSVNRGIDAMNLLDKAFKGTASSQFNWYEKYVVGTLSKAGMLVGMKPVSGGYAEMQSYADTMKQKFGATTKDGLSGAKNNESLSNIMKNIFADKGMSYKEKNRRVAILQEIRKMNLASMDLFKTKENPNTLVKESDLKESKLNTGSTHGETIARQNINISIHNLIEKFELVTNNMSEGASKVKEMVAKALLESVNDVNLIRQ